MSRIFQITLALLLLCCPAVSLASDLAEIMSAHNSKSARIEESRREKLSKLNRTTIKRLQDLQDSYTRAAKLDEALAVRDQIRALQVSSDQSPVESTSPIVYSTTMQSPYHLNAQVGQTFTWSVTGRNTGPLWGTGVYTSDSDLGTAAVHAGFLRVGETADVTFTMLPRQSQYHGTMNHSVTSRDWGVWDGSFRIERAANNTSSSSRSSDNAQPDPGSLYQLNAQPGQTFYFDVTGGNAGYVWGSELYTTDSTLATAAVHAGVLTVGQRGVIKVTILPGLNSYVAATRHGVTSSSWGSFPATMKIEAAK